MHPQMRIRVDHKGIAGLETYRPGQKRLALCSFKITSFDTATSRWEQTTRKEFLTRSDRERSWKVPTIRATRSDRVFRRGYERPYGPAPMWNAGFLFGVIPTSGVDDDRRSLTFGFGTGTAQAVGIAAAQTAVRRAFDTWANAGVGLSFGELEARHNPDIVIEWRPASDPDLSLWAGLWLMLTSLPDSQSSLLTCLFHFTMTIRSTIRRGGTSEPYLMSNLWRCTKSDTFSGCYMSHLYLVQ